MFVRYQYALILLNESVELHPSMRISDLAYPRLRLPSLFKDLDQLPGAADEVLAAPLRQEMCHLFNSLLNIFRLVPQRRLELSRAKHTF